VNKNEFYNAAISRCNRTGETLEDIIKAGEPSRMNDIKALLKMIRTDILPEPARSLAEKLRREI
jgi:hypothetical protein